MALSLRVVIPAALACIAAPSVPAQDEKPQDQKPKFGTIFKREVDGLVNALCTANREDGSIGGSALATAQVLTAMGHCHRFYSLADGPVVRRSVNFLFTRREKDGSFSDRSAEFDAIETTRWVVSALQAADPNDFRAELVSLQLWLTKQGASTESRWDEHVRDVAMRVGSMFDGDPKQAGAEVAAALARGPIRAADGSLAIDANVTSLLTLVACQQIARQLDKGTEIDGADFPQVAQRGFDYLLTRQKDGVFYVKTRDGEFPDTGLSGMGIAALLTKPRALRTDAEQATIDAGLTAILAAQNDDGSFGQHTVNYTTCAAVLALSMANDPAHEKALVSAREFILKIQNIEDRGYARGDRDYGSIGYGGDQRGDLSNLGFAVEALRRSGLDEQHESFSEGLGVPAAHAESAQGQRLRGEARQGRGRRVAHRALRRRRRRGLLSRQLPRGLRRAARRVTHPT